MIKLAKHKVRYYIKMASTLFIMIPATKSLQDLVSEAEIVELVKYKVPDTKYLRINYDSIKTTSFTIPRILRLSLSTGGIGTMYIDKIGFDFYGIKYEDFITINDKEQDYD